LPSPETARERATRRPCPPTPTKLLISSDLCLCFALPKIVLPPPQNCEKERTRTRSYHQKRGERRNLIVLVYAQSPPVPHETQRSQVRILSQQIQLFTVLLNKFSTFPSRDGDYSLVRQQQLTETSICIIFFPCSCLPCDC
jgi:hypothetical protein